MNLLRMIAAEWRKIRGRGLAYAVLLFGVMNGAGAALVLFATGLAGEQVQEGSSDAFDWLVSADFGTWAASVFPLNALVLLVLFAILWAEDFAIGTAAMILVRPVRRAQLFAAKLAMGLLVSFGSILLAMVTAAALGLVLFGLDGDPSQVALPVSAWQADVDGVLSRLVRIVWGTGVGVLLMLPVLGCAALFATLSKSPLLTLAGSILTLVGDAGITAILWAWAKTDLASAEAAGRLKEWTLTSSRDLFEHHGTLTLLSDGAGDLGRTVGYSIVLFGLALLTLQRRDIR